MFLSNLNNRKCLLLLVQVAFSLCLLRDVTGDDNCDKCQALEDKLSSIDRKNRCIRKCEKLQDRNKFSVEPLCDEDCCESLCLANGSGYGCISQGYCEVQPTNLCILCAEYIERGCYRGNLLGNTAFCPPLACGYGEGELCGEYPATDAGQAACLNYIGGLGLDECPLNL